MLMRPTPYVLKVEGVSHSYREGEEVLRGISFEVERGQILCLLGPSGCGKSTLLRIIAGLLSPSSGRIVIDGHDQADIPTHRRNLGFVFQDTALFPHLTVEENISFPFRRGNRRLDEPWPEAVNKILLITDLQSYRARSVATLSGGQAQRVALARALVYQPSLLLLDEPLSALDHRLKEQLIDLLMDLHERFQTSFVYVTHDEREALRIGTHIAVINQRHELQQFGPVADVIKKPATSDVAAAIGGWNLLPAVITQQGVHRGLMLENGISISSLNINLNVGEKVTLGIPIQAIRIAPDQTDRAAADLNLRVKILRRSPVYNGWLYDCHAEGPEGMPPAKISCYGNSLEGLIASEFATLSFREEDIHVFD